MVSQSASEQPSAPAKTNLARLERALREIAEKRQRVPPISVLSEQLSFPHTLLYNLLMVGVERGLWEIVRPQAGFLQIIGRGWRTLSFEEWKHSRTEYHRKCLRCRKDFTSMHRHRFMCDFCNSSI